MAHNSYFNDNINNNKINNVKGSNQQVLLNFVGVLIDLILPIIVNWNQGYHEDKIDDTNKTYDTQNETNDKLVTVNNNFNCENRSQVPSCDPGETSSTGVTSANGSGSAFIETLKIGDINSLIASNVSGGNSQAIGTLIFNGQQTTISRLATYVTQLGANTGTFQLVVLQPINQTEATIIAFTTIATSLTEGIFVLPLTAPVTLVSNTVYYLAAFNQINGSTLGGRSTGPDTVVNTFPINFRSQNLDVLTVGQSINTSDVKLLLSPYICGLV